VQEEKRKKNKQTCQSFFNQMPPLKSVFNKNKNFFQEKTKPLFKIRG
jgi:hypothetical protein